MYTTDSKYIFVTCIRIYIKNTQIDLWPNFIKINLIFGVNTYKYTNKQKRSSYKKHIIQTTNVHIVLCIQIDKT